MRRLDANVLPIIETFQFSEINMNERMHSNVLAIYAKKAINAAILSVSALCSLTPQTAIAHTRSASEASALSGIAVGMVVAAPSVALVGVASMAVVAVTVVADGTMWVLERASDGARFVVKVSAAAVGGASLVVGAAVTVTAVSAGWVLSTAGQVIAFVPNTLGQALLHHERVVQ